jgi:hypothetical protein
MFLARRVVLVGGTMFVALLIVWCLEEHVSLLTDPGELLLLAGLLWLAGPLRLSLLVVLGGTLVTSYYVFRVGLREASLKYAIGHLLLCIALTFMVPIIGIVFVPLLVQCDIERWRRSEGELPDGYEPRR